MIKRYSSIIVLACLLSACAAPHTKEMARQNRQSIDDAMTEAATVTIAEVEAPTQEILDDLAYVDWDQSRLDWFQNRSVANHSRKRSVVLIQKRWLLSPSGKIPISAKNQ